MNIIQNTDNSFLKPRDAWDRLSMEEQAAMMKVAVQNGIFDLATIRQKYNEFAEGGSTDTNWSYNSWKKQIAEHMDIRPDEDNTYDYKAFFKKYPEETWRMLKGDPTAHFSDEFKTVYHPTFSSKSIGNDGSIYSGVKNPKTNPQGLVGGTWSPDYHTFTMSPDGYRGPVSMDDRKWYLENAEDGGVQLREANGSLPIYDDIPWAGVLPTVTVTGNKHSIGGPLVENLFDGESEDTQQMTVQRTPHVDLAISNPWLYNKLHPSEKKEKPYEPTTFAGRVAQVSGAGELGQKYADYSSSVIQQVPGIGLVPSALDLGYDANRMYHNPSTTTAKDVALDAASLLPALRKTLKGWWMKGNSGSFITETGQVLNNPRVASSLEVMLQPYRTAVNTGIYAGRAADFLDDSKAYLKDMYNDSPIGKHFPIKALGGPIVEAAMNEYKHGDGGNLFEEAGQLQIGLNVPKIGLDTQGWPSYTTEQIIANGERIQQQRKAIQDAYLNYITESNDATAVANGRSQNQHLTERAIEGAKAHAAWEKDNPVMTTVGLGLGAVPLAVATLPAVVPAGEAMASTAAGQLATKFLTHPITETAGVAMSGEHGLSNLFSGNANALTALELAPLAFPYGNFIKGTGEAINFVGSKIPTPIKEAWANRAEKAAMFFGDEGKTWTRVTDPKGKEGIVFLNTNNSWKTTADWLLHPQQTYRDFRSGYYPMTRKQWKNYLTEEQKVLDYAKQKSIELNDAQLKQRLSLQQENFLDNRVRNNSASIKINTNPNSPFSLPRAPRNASEVANNVKVVSRDKDVSYGGKWFDPKFGTGTAAVSHPDKNIIVLPRHYQTQFSNRLTTMPGRGYTSPIETRMHMYVHELQHQMQQNLPLLNLSQPNATTMYYEPWNHFLSNIDSENLLLPFKETAQKYPGSWLASPNEYNAESNAYRVVDDYRGRRSILDPLDEVNASRLNGFGLNFDQIESLWNMGYKEGGHLRR